MNVNNELTDYEAAGSLAEELPWWGWLEDDRTCLTRAGELLSIGRLTPSVLDGQTPGQMDRVIDRWCRMLSGLDPRSRLHFYLLRRPVRFADESDGAPSSVAALGRQKRRAFLEQRVQDVSAYVAWAHDPHLSSVATQKMGGPWWRATARNWMARRRNPHESIYLQSSIESAAAGFRQIVEASRVLVDDLTPLRVLEAREASLVLNELTNRPGTFWEGATGSGMNWRLAVSELEAERRNLRLDGEPVILYSLLSPPGAACANLLEGLYRLDATMTVATWNSLLATAGAFACAPSRSRRGSGPFSSSPVGSRVCCGSAAGRPVAKIPARFAPASKIFTPLHPGAGPWGRWFVPCPRRCGRLWGVGTETERGRGTSTTRPMGTISTSRTGR